jgi:chitinase
VTPIDRADGGADLETAIRQYAAAHVPASRIVLGLPLYGRSWPVIGPYRYAPRVGAGVTWLPSKHVEQLSAPAFAPFGDDLEVVEYLPEGSGTGYRSVFYDSPRTLAPKLALARTNGYAGAGFWAIGYERGAPGYLALMADFIAGRIDRAGAAAGIRPPDGEPCVTLC